MLFVYGTDGAVVETSVQKWKKDMDSAFELDKSTLCKMIGVISMISATGEDLEYIKKKWRMPNDSETMGFQWSYGIPMIRFNRP